MIIKKRPILIATVSILLFLCVVVLYFLHVPLVKDEQGFKYTVPPGTTMKAVVDDLYRLNVIKHPVFFNWLVNLRGDRYALKSGEYLFPKGVSTSALLTQITMGTGMIYHPFTIIPGWDFKQIRTVLNNDANVQHDSASLTDAEIMVQMGQPELNPEAQFFPETYYFARGTTDVVLLKRAFKMMQDKVDQMWLQREVGLPYKTENDALVVASLVEKETSLNQERPIIAGVILNRLKKNMPLQIDPTVIYALGDKYRGTVSKADLRMKSPYNTYLNKGLPPTPIATPSIASIEAALHPQQHDYLYFVAKDTNYDSGHQFSKTLAEHNVAVAEAKKRKAAAVRYYFLKNPSAAK